ncbi:MAG: hypothetical protein ABIB43_06170 [archaeon]
MFKLNQKIKNKILFPMAIFVGLGGTFLNSNDSLSTANITPIKSYAEYFKKKIQHPDKFIKILTDSDEHAFDKYFEFNPFLNINQPIYRENESFARRKFISNSMNRFVNIGVAYEGQIDDNFTSAISEANVSLNSYGITINVGENVEVDLPNYFNASDYAYAITGSFSKPMDYYFVLTDSTKIPDSTQVVKANLLDSHVRVLNSSSTKDDLEKVISTNILKCFSDEMNYDEIMSNLRMKLSENNYDVKKVVDGESIILVNIGLDVTSKEKANLVLKRANEMLSGDSVKIVLNPVDMYEFNLPENWKTGVALKYMKAGSKQPSKIYALFTDRDWTAFSRDENSWVYTLSDPNKLSNLIKAEEKGRGLLEKTYLSTAGWSNTTGYLWIETVYDIDISAEILVHELGHLLGANHVYKLGATMHPITYSNDLKWTPKSLETIQKNRFRSWIWSETK